MGGYVSAQKNSGSDAGYTKYLELIALKDDSVKCERLIEHSRIMVDSLQDYDFAILILQKTEAFLKEKNFPTLRLKLYNQWGYSNYMKGDFEAADTYYVKALGLKIIDSDQLLKADILNRAGANLQNLSAFKRALTYYNEALEIYSKLNDEKGKGNVYINMANIFVLSGDFEQSDAYFDKAANLFIKNKQPQKYSVVLSNKSLIRSRTGKPEEAKSLLLQSLHLDYDKSKNFDHYIVTHFNTGLIYAELKKWDSCFYYFKRGKFLVDSVGLADTYDASYDYYLGYCYRLKGDLKKAIVYYKDALKMHTGIADFQGLYNNIASLYFELKQYDTAFLYKTEGARIADSIYKSEVQERIKFENKRLDLLEKDYKNQIRSAEQEQNLSNLQKRNYLLIGLVILLAAVGLVFFLYFKQYKLKEKKEHLQSELDFLKAQLNPHFLFNSINNIYVLQSEDKDKASEVLLKFSELLRYQLYECNVATLPLSKEIQFVENYIEFEKLRYSNKILVNYQCTNNLAPDLTISPLLLQPFVENAFKHTPKNKNNLSRIDIRINVEGEHLLFEVSNTLAVSSPSGLPGGIGLENVKKRLKLLYAGKHELLIQKTESEFKISLKLNLKHD